MTAVDCVHAAKSFDTGAVRAVDDVTLHVPSGQITAIVGPSGCGKTTLLRCIAGLETLSSGEIFIGDRDVTGLEPRERGIGMVFQNAGLYPDKTVAENIAFPLKMGKVAKSERTERVREAAELVRMTDRLDRFPHELSGGQRQRVGIARALVRNPSVVLMDEPLSALDESLRTDMRRDLRALQQRLGLTIVFVTHDQNEAMTLADQLVVFFAGSVAQTGTPGEIFGRPARVDVAEFLGAMNTVPAEVLSLTSASGTVGFRAEDAVVGTATVTASDPVTVVGTATVTASDPVTAEDVAVMHGEPEYGELHGSDALLAVAVGGHRIHIRVPGDRLDVLTRQSRVSIAVPRAQLHWFDTDGNRAQDRTMAQAQR